MYPRIHFEALDAESSGAALAPEAEAADGPFFASLAQPTTVYILRHGQSEGNATMTFQGRLDYPLDATGLRQAHAAARWFEDKRLDAVLSSPMSRAAATASLIAGTCGLEVQTLDALAEVDVGLFSGMSVERAEAEHPDIFRRFSYSSWDAVPGAEHSSRMYFRAMRSWERIRELAVGGARNILCVSHGGLIQFLIRATFGAKTWLPLYPVGNCGISRFDIEPTGEGLPAFTQWRTINFQTGKEIS